MSVSDAIAAFQELKRRKIDGVRLFRPSPQQEPFFLCRDSEILLRGGNRCIPGWQEIYDPVAKASRRVDSIDGDFHVWSRDPSTGKRVIAKASKPFMKGHGKFRRYETHCSDRWSGGEFVSTEDHTVLLSDGSWRPVYQLASSYFGEVVYKWKGGENRRKLLAYLSAHGDHRIPEMPFSRDITLEPSFPSDYSDSVRICDIGPAGEGDVWDFTVEGTSNYELAGIIHHNSGKTLCSSVRFAAIARDVPVTFHDGTEVDLRLPHQKGRPLLMWCVGYDLRHIGQTLHRVLFRANLYKIIPDKETGQWRAYDPSREDDRKRENECKASPPLIPESEIEEMTWENRGERQFSTVTLKNGTIICAFSSMGEVKAGDPVDEIWVDEAIKYPQHYPEWQARLSDRRGRLLWSSWPKRDNMALRTLTKRAKERKDDPKSKDSVSEFILRFSENKFIDPDERDKRIAGWSEQDRIARDLGEYALDSLKMYPSFAPEIHCAYGYSPESDDALAHVLRDRNGQPPVDWTRGICLDPGTANPGVLKFAVPPLEFGEYLVIYQEVYPGRADADQVAKKVADLSAGEQFEWFIGDGHAMRITPMGVGMTTGQLYSDAFRKCGLYCHQTGSAFTYGSDDVLGRIGMVQRLLTIRSNGLPKLRIVTASCPNLIRQMGEYERQEVDGPQGPVILDLPAPRQKIDLAVCLEYIASRDPQHVPRPVTSGRATSGASRAWARIKEESERQRGGQPVVCGVEAAARSKV